MLLEAKKEKSNSRINSRECDFNIFNDLDNYIFNYKELEKEYNYSQKVIDNL